MEAAALLRGGGGINVWQAMVSERIHPLRNDRESGVVVAMRREVARTEHAEFELGLRIVLGCHSGVSSISGLPEIGTKRPSRLKPTWSAARPEPITTVPGLWIPALAPPDQVRGRSAGMTGPLVRNCIDGKEQFHEIDGLTGHAATQEAEPLPHARMVL